MVPPGRPYAQVPRGAISIQFGNENIFFSAGIFYQWANGSYISINAPVGVIVPTLPAGCEMQVVGGSSYYVYNGVYYRRATSGYVVVETPVVVNEPVYAEAAPAAPQNVTVWIQNGNGSRTPVVLTPSDDGQWVGPKGEYYQTFPTQDQLASIYGLKTTQQS